MEKTIVKIENVSHRYSIQWAIRDISIDIPEKGIYGLLGSNGAGKSTMMNILCGTLRQTQGDIWIKGINTNERSVAAKRLIGFLPQKPPLQMDLTVEEFLYHCAGIRLMDKKDIPAAVENAMTECGILHFRNHGTPNPKSFPRNLESLLVPNSYTPKTPKSLSLSSLAVKRAFSSFHNGKMQYARYT